MGKQGNLSVATGTLRYCLVDGERWSFAACLKVIIWVGAALLESFFSDIGGKLAITQNIWRVKVSTLVLIDHLHVSFLIPLVR
jgi:hypothetical protein